MGSSTIGKGDTSRSGLRGDKKGGYGVFTEKTYSNVGAKGPNLAGYTSIAPAPKTVGGKVAVEKPPAKLPAPTGVQTVTPVKTKNVPRTYVSTFKPMAKKPVVAAVVKKPTIKPNAKKITPSMLRSALGMGPSKSAPRGSMAINPRTGNTTGFTTGTTTGSSASKPGVAGKTYQSAYDRQMSNALNRTNQPAGPMGGGGGTRGSGSSRSTSSGGGNLGGAAGRGEPRGSKK